MVRRLLGMNRTFTIKRRQRVVSPSGSASEATSVTIASGVPGAIQAHVLSNLPPPGERPVRGGLFRQDEFRLWLGDTTNAVDAQLDDLIEEEGTSPLRVYRVFAVLDEAGRGHHQLLRVEAYSQESSQFAQKGDKP